jgi:hypothetical protein
VLYRDRPNSEIKNVVLIIGFVHGLDPVKYKDA